MIGMSIRHDIKRVAEGTRYTAVEVIAFLRKERKLGEISWNGQYGSRRNNVMGDLPGWPGCECGGCGCTEPATTTDDAGVPVCDVCENYAIDDDGDVICSRSERAEELETVTECCGAGGQTRSYMRLRPPEQPDQDPEGEYEVWWETAGDDSHRVGTYADRATADQAVSALDWPPPGDHTTYLCGYAVRGPEE